MAGDVMQGLSGGRHGGLGGASWRLFPRRTPLGANHRPASLPPPGAPLAPHPGPGQKALVRSSPG